MIKKIVLAYSGGLDTSVILKWLQEKYKVPVIALLADVGQGEDLEDAKERATKIGTEKVIVKNLKEKFVKDFVLKGLQANAIYEDKYLLATALSRPLIAESLVEVAKEEKANAVAHGCTGKGNDQVRLEVSIAALAPDMKILAPVREWEFKTREEELNYAEKHNIPLESQTTKKSLYSIDKNLWGVSIECGILEDPWKAPPEEIYQLTTSPEKAPDKATYLEVDFEDGIPKKIDGKEYKSVDLIAKLNEIGGTNGIGRVDHIESRVVGIKSREIYEAPAGRILYLAHKEMENLTLTRQTLEFKALVDKKYSELIYSGMWHSPLKKALDAFIEKTQEGVTGTVKLKLYKGNCIIVGRKSPYSLYSQALATYGKGDIFDQKLAKGFIEILGLPIKVKAKVKKEK